MCILFVLCVVTLLLMAGFQAYQNKAKVSCMDYGFHMVITKWDDVVSRDMEIMVKEHCINSFKFFTEYKGALMVSDDLLLEGLKRCKSLGALAMVHAENGDAVVEGQKMIELVITGLEGHALSRPLVGHGVGVYFLHLCSFVIVFIEFVTLSKLYFVFSKRMQASISFPAPVVYLSMFLTSPVYVMSPPIRASGHAKALQAALSTGLLQLVGTDHCVFNSTQKGFGIDDFWKIPNGVNGIEERMHLVWDTMVEYGQISANDYVPLKGTEWIFNVYPRKGSILAGSDADIIILNPNSSFEISSSSHHSRIYTMLVKFV
ncbi:LOW QUALITY PROTEIN: hypothetical protein CFOL_v3_23818 [Cephalotus follicularis]|uniref:Uncharacterized protein n=1 Tax=Cephalotus follicularis TaxID=3775 RepID=A0A1Q3CJG0_CEPFO|nr:LOW QUALITY PROTEIN: hypothetical protein CFOL_v3_23818 [Cephalotus follicularis]